MDASIIKIQKMVRGFLCRIKRLPLFLYIIRKYLSSILYSFSISTDDGRINSFIDENNIIKILYDKYGENRIKIPKIRMWYDILIYDKLYGWIPINIKSTTTTTRDNTGNLAICVHAYTDEKLDLHNNKTYENGKMSLLFIQKLKNKNYNYNFKKDYYFLVLNKNNPKDIIINSIKGLNILSSNNNNLPFQICWNKNREYNYNGILKSVGIFIKTLHNIKHNWKKNFIDNIKKINRKRKIIDEHKQNCGKKRKIEDGDSKSRDKKRIKL
jgi:hypothetical protein